MQIGTPLSSSATRVMLLGSGELGKEVIIALQRLGAEVIAVDRYANAPGHQVAHRAHVIDMSDAKALRELVAQEKPQLIVPEIEAIATDLLVELEREEAMTVIPTARAAQLTMNREGIRRLAAEELAIPTSKYRFAETFFELEAAVSEIGYPCIIKPIMSSSGKGQSLLRSADDVQSAWEYAIQGGRVNQEQVIVEQKIDFDFEITLLTVRYKNAMGEVVTVFCAPIGHRQIDGDYVESWQPQPMSSVALQAAQSIAQRITDNLAGCGLFGVEFFVKGDQVWFSEVSPRPHDTGMVTMASQYQNEFECHARAILGLPVSVELRNPAASAVIYGAMDQRAVIFENVDKALSIPGSDIRLFGKPEAYRRRRMGVALAYGESVECARQRANLVASQVIVKASKFP